MFFKEHSTPSSTSAVWLGGVGCHWLSSAALRLPSQSLNLSSSALQHRQPCMQRGEEERDTDRQTDRDRAPLTHLIYVYYQLQAHLKTIRNCKHTFTLQGCSKPAGTGWLWFVPQPQPPCLSLFSPSLCVWSSKTRVCNRLVGGLDVFAWCSLNLINNCEAAHLHMLYTLLLFLTHHSWLKKKKKTISMGGVRIYWGVLWHNAS